MKKLSDLKNVGKATLADLHLLGIYTVEDLSKQDPTLLFHKLEQRTQVRQDPCVWDVFAAIIHEAAGREPTVWWEWTPKRKVLQKQGLFTHVEKYNRPKISIYIAASMDGYIAREDGGLDWLEYGHVGDEDYGFKKFMSTIDAIVLGRNTYQVVSRFENWPYQGKRVIVLSRTLQEVRREAELFCGELSDLAAMLHADGIKHIWVDGGITLSKFVELDLIDEITLSIIPTILGAGIPLFSSIHKEHKCRLLSTQAYPSGLVQLKYEVITGDSRCS